MGIVETLAWAGIAVATWLATLSSITVPDLIVALVTGVAAGMAATTARRALEGSWRLRSSWLTWLTRLPITVVAETGALLRRSATTNPPRGRLHRSPLPDEPAATRSGREAVGILTLSATPGSIVADWDAESRELAVHVLVAAGPDIGKVIRQ